MDSLIPVALVHFYDTSLHRIVCGKRGAEHRSTKHARSVTCDACLGLLRERPTLAAPNEAVEPAGGAAAV
jgi:hypothetical protein